MTMGILEKTLQQIEPVDKRIMTEAEIHQKELAIPEGSLGRLHEIGVRLAGITRNPRPVIQKTGVITMAGDHGVVDQGVSRFPREVTLQMVGNFLRRGAAVNVLAERFGARITVVDMGIAVDVKADDALQGDGIRFVSRKIARGTNDISRGPAMTRGQALSSVENGIEVLNEEVERGLDAVGTGDMGIGNTTPSSAVASVILGCGAKDVVNRGTGIDDGTFLKKIRVVDRAVERNRPDPEDPLDILAKVGGFEIGGIAGVILGAAAMRIPVVIDGFISTAAALLAVSFNPVAAQYIFAGHRSDVDGHGKMLRFLGQEPVVDLKMRLGEGTGAVFGLAVLGAASDVATKMLTFREAAVTGPGEE